MLKLKGVNEDTERGRERDWQTRCRSVETESEESV